MGIQQTTMRSYAAVMMLSMLLVGDAALADTADLDDEDFDDDDDELGESEGVGRAGGYLSTTGSFTLSGGNAAGAEEDELGEGVGRGGGYLSTQGSFTLSGANAAGAEEESDE